MSRALMIVDVQKYFTAGIPGGTAIAASISAYLVANKADYDMIIACRDWHDGDNDNGGHFAWNGQEPDFVSSWPIHCVAGEPDGDYDPQLDTALIDVHIKKGQGKPDYSIFGGITDEGERFEHFLSRRGITELHACGLSTNGCVRASVLDALATGYPVTVLASLSGGRSQELAEEALREMSLAGAVIRS